MIPTMFMVTLSAIPESVSDTFKERGGKGQFDNIEKMEEKLGFNAHVDINLSLNLNKIFITISCN